MRELLKRIEAIHSTKCFKTTSLAVANGSFVKISQSRERLIEAIKNKADRNQVQELMQEIRQEWDEFMEEAPVVTEEDINKLHQSRS